MTPATPIERPELSAAALDSLLSEAAVRRHRAVVVLCGEAAQCRAAAQKVLQSLDEALSARSGHVSALWVGQPPALTPLQSLRLQSLAAHHGNRFLGSEHYCLVYDAFAGLNPDSLAALAGTLRAGGLLLLLAPELDQWPSYPDPDYLRMLVYPQTPEHSQGHFLRWLADSLKGALKGSVRHSVRRCVRQHSLGLTIYRPAEHFQGPLSVTWQGDDELTNSRVSRPSAEQQPVVEAIAGLAQPKTTPVVLTADRGRGKSAAMGMAAARIMLQRPATVVVTAPRYGAVTTLFQHAAACLSAEVTEQVLDLELELGTDALWVKDPQGGVVSALRFVAPDELLAAQPAADVVLVDEAAAIPAPMLQALLSHYPQIAFATTVHGYEGSGRGFEIRFAKVLDRLAPGWQALRLQAPIRWAADDPLENWLFTALLMDAEPASAEQLQALGDDNFYRRAQLRQLSAEQLLAEPGLLRQVFALLVQAHYRTTPGDLRDLLDGSNLQTWVLQYRGVVAGVLMLAREGGFQGELLQHIWLGKRRPRGHLLPQTLSAQLGWRDSAQLHYSRVVRIAVHPLLQNKGLGSAMLAQFRQQADADNSLDFIGASYAASPELMRFWLRAGYQCVRVGLTRDAASGCHSALVLLPVSAKAQPWLAAIRARHHRLLQHDLQHSLRGLEPELVALLRPDLLHTDKALAEPIALEPKDAGAPVLGHSGCTWQDCCDLYSYIHGHRGFEQVHGVLQPWLRHLQQQPELYDRLGLSASQQQLLTLKIEQNLSWSQCVQHQSASGRKQLEQQLRQLLKRPFALLLEQAGLTLAAFEYPPHEQTPMDSQQ